MPPYPTSLKHPQPPSRRRWKPMDAETTKQKNMLEELQMHEKKKKKKKKTRTQKLQDDDSTKTTDPHEPKRGCSKELHVERKHESEETVMNQFYTEREDKFIQKMKDRKLEHQAVKRVRRGMRKEAKMGGKRGRSAVGKTEVEVVEKMEVKEPESNGGSLGDTGIGYMANKAVDVDPTSKRQARKMGVRWWVDLKGDERMTPRHDWKW